MVLRDFYERILYNTSQVIYQTLQSRNSPQLNAVLLIEIIINNVEEILGITRFVKTDEYVVGGTLRNTINNVLANYKRYLRQYTSLIPIKSQASTIIKQFTTNTNLRDETLKSIIFGYLLQNPKIYNLGQLEYEGREVRTLDEAISAEENTGPAEIKEEPGMRDLFTNSELVQDNITELNKLIERINLELYNNLSSGDRFNEKRVNGHYTTVQDLENDLIRLSSNDTKMISDKFDLIINDLKDGDSANHYETVRNYFKLGIYPLKKVNVSDQNKPTKNANLITGTQNIYKVENTQNPLKISSYVNNDLGDYVVNGKKINIKLVGLNYIVKEGAKTKIFKSLSYAKQFIYNGGFDMYNNNKSKFINNVSKDFNNKKQPLRLSYSSNIF